MINFFREIPFAQEDNVLQCMSSLVHTRYFGSFRKTESTETESFAFWVVRHKRPSLNQASVSLLLGRTTKGNFARHAQSFCRFSKELSGEYPPNPREGMAG